MSESTIQIALPELAIFPRAFHVFSRASSSDKEAHFLYTPTREPPIPASHEVCRIYPVVVTSSGNHVGTVFTLHPPHGLALVLEGTGRIATDSVRANAAASSLLEASKGVSEHPGACPTSTVQRAGSFQRLRFFDRGGVLADETRTAHALDPRTHELPVGRVNRHRRSSRDRRLNVALEIFRDPVDVATIA
jgi:hypothetical protein